MQRRSQVNINMIKFMYFTSLSEKYLNIFPGIIVVTKTPAIQISV